jgi:cytochrome c551/c552
MKSNVLLLLFLLTVSLMYAAPPVEEGKAIFTSRCAGCHNIKKQVLGPALAGVDERRSIDWIVNFVHSSQTMIQKGDKDAVALFKQFNNIPMPDHKDLSDDNIKSVVAYIKSEATVADKKVGSAVDQTKEDKGLFQIITGTPSWLLIFSLLTVLLVTTLILAFKVSQYRRQATAVK